MKTIKVQLEKDEHEQLLFVQEKLGRCSQPAAMRIALSKLYEQMQPQCGDQPITTAYELQTQA